MKRVAIFGGGITGLTVAWCLSARGYQVEVFEKDQVVGGLAKTLEFNNQKYDLGPHEFCTNNPYLVNLLQDVLGGDLLVLEKRAAQHFDGQYIDYPIKPIRFFLQVDKVLAIQVLSEIVYYRLKSLCWDFGDYSFKHWVERRFGKTLYKVYFGPYSKKVWGIDPENLDPRTASDRIAFNSFFDLIYQTAQYFIFNKTQYDDIHNPLKKQFYYSRYGIGNFIVKLSEKCNYLGCIINTNWEVKEILREGSEIVGIVNQNGEIAEGFELYINTIPITLLAEKLNAGYGKIDLQFRSMIFCFIEIPVDTFSPFSWIYFPESSISFQRLTEFSHFNADMTKPGYTGICVEISCFENDTIWKLSDDDIIQKVKRDLVGIGLLDKTTNVTGFVWKERHAYPIQHSGFLENVRRLLCRIKKVENLITTGRQGLYKYCNMNECMEMALDLTESIMLNKKPVNYNLHSKWRGAGIEKERTL